MVKNNSVSKSRKGFTLVEILIGVGAAGVIGAILVGLLAQNSRIFSFQSSKVNQGVELNNSYDEIEQTIKTAGGVVSQYPATGQPTHTTGLNTLVMTIPAITAQGAVIQNTNDYVVFTRDTQNQKILRKLLYPNVVSSRKLVNKVLSTKTSLLEFRYLDSADQSISPVQASKIGFIINVSDMISTESQSSSVSGRINLRNN